MTGDGEDDEPRAGTEVLVARGASVPYQDRRLRQVAHGVAHGMNNVLATIMGLASVIERELGTEHPLTEDMRAILSASERGLELTRGLLSLAHEGAAAPTPVALDAVVGRVVGFLRPSLPTTLRVETELASEPALVLADRMQLKQAVAGLALDVTRDVPEHGVLRFATYGAGSADAPTVALRVECSGDAPPDSEPARRARAEISEALDGLGGTLTQDGPRALRVELPAVDPEQASSLPPAGEAQPSSGCVLLVEDEPLVLRSLERLVRALGYEAVSTRTGEEALRAYAAEPARFNLVLLDLVMPGMDGREVLTRLKAQDPELNVVITTGYGGEPIQELLEAGATGAIQKPYTLKQLRRVLKRLS